MGTATDQRAPPLAVTVAIFVLAFLVPAWPWLSGAVTVPYDAKSTFYPPVAFMAQAFAAGESPFWTPNVFAGFPNIADPQSMLASPLHVLLAFATATPSFRAVDTVSFAYLLLGGLGIILYFRDRGWHAAGALVAALAFAFGGAASARLQHTGQVISLAWLPIALWLLSRALERNSWRWGALAGLGGAMIALGRDQVALLALYLLAGYVVAHWIAARRASLKALAAGAISGAAVIAVPFLMTELLALNSNRPAFSLVEAGRGSLHPTHLLSLVFADLYGAMDPTVDYWGAGGFLWNERFGMAGLFLAQNMGLLYAGALVPVALVIGVTRGLLWSSEVRFFSIAAVLIALYAFGWYTPAFRAMYELLPGVSLFRRPADATFLLGALLAILTGYVVHRWLADTAVASLPRRTVELAIAAFAVICAIWLATTIEAGGSAVKPIVLGIVFVAAAILALRVARRLSAAAIAVLAAFSTFDLSFNNAPHESTGLPPAIYDALRPGTTNETVALIREHPAAQGENHRDRVELIGLGYHWPNLCMVQKCEHVFGHNPLRLKWFADATRAGDTVAAADQRVFSALYPGWRSPFADLFGARIIATGVPAEQIDPSLKPGDLTFLARTADAYVYEKGGALPRVMLLGDWKAADFGKLIADGWPADVDPAKTALLPFEPPEQPVAVSGAVRLARYANTEVIIEVDTPTGGLLVLNDVWHPWWRATVNGRAREILRANVVFRAVFVPAGKSTVRFTFEPLRGAWEEVKARLGGKLSFRPSGARAGIQNHYGRDGVMDFGLAASRRPGMTATARTP